MVNNRATMRRQRPLSLGIPRPPTPPRGQRSRSKSPGQIGGLVSLSPYRTEKGDWEDVSPRVGDIVRKFEGLNKGNVGYKLDFSSPVGCFRNESRSSGIVSDFEETEEVEMEVDSKPFKNFQPEIAQSSASSSSEAEADAEDKLSQDFLKQNASEESPNFLDSPNDDTGCWLTSDDPEDDVNVPSNQMSEEDLHFYDQVDYDDGGKIEIESGSGWLAKAAKVVAFLYLASGTGYGLFLLGLETYFGNAEMESDGLKMNLAWGGFLLLKFLVFYKFLGIFSLLRNGTPIVSSHLKQLFLLLLQPSLFLVSSTSSPEVNLEASEILFTPKSKAETEIEPEDSGFLDDDQDSFVNNNSQDYSEFLSQAEANNGNNNNNHGLSWLSLLTLGVLQLGSALGPLTMALTQSTPPPNLNLNSDILLRSFLTFGLPVQFILLVFLKTFFSNKIKTH